MKRRFFNLNAQTVLLIDNETDTVYAVYNRFREVLVVNKPTLTPEEITDIHLDFLAYGHIKNVIHTDSFSISFYDIEYGDIQFTTNCIDNDGKLIEPKN